MKREGTVEFPEENRHKNEYEDDSFEFSRKKPESYRG